MKLYIRYYRNFVFGNYATQGFEIDPDSLVIDLKHMIFARIRIEPKFQILRIKNHGQLEVMNDDVSLGFYNIKEENFIYLENIQQKTDESQVSVVISISLVVVNQGHCAKNHRIKQSKVPAEVRANEKYD